MFNPLEILVYGERDSNLNIKSVGFEKLDKEIKEMIKGELEKYTGDFIVTNQGYLLRGCDTDLGTPNFAELNLYEYGNTVRGLLREKRVHIYYCVDNCVIKRDNIIKDWKGLRIEEYIPFLKRPCPFERERRFAFA